jgi:acetyltransferase-like isoleucine patch superfamily enzyme
MSTEPQLGEDCEIQANVSLGDAGEGEPPVIGNESTIRSGAIIYPDVTIGDRFTTGHNVLIREQTTIGDDVVAGTNTVIDGTTTIGSCVSIQTGVYIPTETTIGDNVFLGPHAVLTNDPYPIRKDVDLIGPILEDGVSIGANATVLPGVAIGEGSFVAAGAVVTEDVPPNTLAVGTPAVHRRLPEPLQGGNAIQ